MRKEMDLHDKLIRDLIVQVKRGDQAAFEELLKTFEPLLISMVNRANLKQDEDDVKQDLTLAFYNAILSYNLTQSEVSFGLYAKVCLNNALVTYLRAIKKKKGLETVPLDDENFEQIDVDDPFVAVIKSEELRELNRRIAEALSPFETVVWRSYVAGCSSREIAKDLNKDVKSIDNAIFRIRKKLKPLFVKK